MAKKKSKTKTSSKKNKSRSSSTGDEERKRNDLIKKAKELKEKLENETNKRNDFETKIQQLQFYWELEKEELQNKTIEYEQIECDQHEIQNEYHSKVELIRGRIKLLLYQNQNQLIQSKNESKIEYYKLQGEHLIERRKHDLNTLECQQHLTNMKTSHNNFLHQLRREHDDEMKQLHEEYKFRFNDITTDAERKVKELKDEVELELKDNLTNLENKKNVQVKELFDQHDEELSKLRHEYNRKVHDELDRIKALKEELSKKRYKFRQTEKKLNEVKGQNKSIIDPLNEVKVEAEKLKVEIEKVKSDKEIFNQRKNELKLVEEKLKDVQWRYEVLFQRYELLQGERNSLKSDLDKSVLAMKQRNNLQSMIVQKMKNEVHDTLQSKHDLILNNIKNNNCAKKNLNISGKSLDSDIYDILSIQKQLLKKLEHAMELLDLFGNNLREPTVEKKYSHISGIGKRFNMKEIEPV